MPTASCLKKPARMAPPQYLIFLLPYPYPISPLRPNIPLERFHCNCRPSTPHPSPTLSSPTSISYFINILSQDNLLHRLAACSQLPSQPHTVTRLTRPSTAQCFLDEYFNSNYFYFLFFKYLHLLARTTVTSRKNSAKYPNLFYVPLRPTSVVTSFRRPSTPLTTFFNLLYTKTVRSHTHCVSPTACYTRRLYPISTHHTSLRFLLVPFLAPFSLLSRSFLPSLLFPCLLACPCSLPNSFCPS